MLRVVRQTKQTHPGYAESWDFRDELDECLDRLLKNRGKKGVQSLIRLARMRGDVIAQFRALANDRLVANSDELKPVVSQPPLKELKFPAQSLGPLRVYFAEEEMGDPDYVFLLAHLKGDGGVWGSSVAIDQNGKMAIAQERYVSESGRRWGHLSGRNACALCETLIS